MMGFTVKMTPETYYESQKKVVVCVERRVRDHMVHIGVWRRNDGREYLYLYCGLTERLFRTPLQSIADAADTMGVFK